MALALVAVVALVYLQTLSFGFVRDDEPLNLTQNPLLNGPTGSHLGLLWTRSYEGLYIPLSYTVWAVLRALGVALMGPTPPFHPQIFHLANVLLHAANVVLVWRLLMRISRSTIASLFGATIYAVHPLQAESVAWVSELRGLLCALFAYSAILTFLEGHARRDAPRRWRRFGASALLVLLSLLAKPSGIVTPVLAVLLAGVVFHVPWRRLAMSAIPQLVVILPFAYLTKRLQPTSYLPVVAPLWQRPLVWLDSITFYLAKVFWPFALGTSYDRRPEAVFEHWTGYCTWVVAAGLGAWLWARRKTLGGYGLALLLFVIGYLPVSGLVPFAYQKWSTVADRFLYLPMLGVALAATLAYARFGARAMQVTAWAVVAALALRTGVTQLPTWKDELTLWEHSLEVSPGDARAYLCVADIYNARGTYDRAIEYYDRGLALRLDGEGYNSRGNVYRSLKQDGRARSDYDSALVLNPRDGRAYNNRGNLFLAEAKYDSALQDYRKALELTPRDPRVYVGRGNVYLAVKDYPRAIADYGTAIAMEPRDARFYANRALAYLGQGDSARAVDDLSRAVERDPGFVTGYLNRARLYFEHADYARSADDLSRVIELAPGNVDALKNRAHAYLLLGRYDPALVDLKRAQQMGQDVSAELQAVEAARGTTQPR
jgi:tetratricopeptide (TPR) repeat protein